jgi:hypothetical protein
MFLLADPIVDWTAMWKIGLVVLIAGTGSVVVFGFLLLGLKFANRLGTAGTGTAGTGTAGTETGGARLGGYLLALACAVIVIGIIVIGVYAMVNKPS